MKKSISNPLPTGNLEDECRKAVRVLREFLDTKREDRLIPMRFRRSCRGIVVLSVVRAGFIVTGRVGSGLVIVRRPTGGWTAPALIGTGGLGFGASIGGEVLDIVILLNTESAVKAFTKKGNLTLGASLGLTAGPVGRGAEASGSVTLAPMFSYAKSAGLYAGISLEGTVIVSRNKDNKKQYGPDVKPAAILRGDVPTPPIANELVDLLEQKFGLPGGHEVKSSHDGNASFHGSADTRSSGSSGSSSGRPSTLPPAPPQQQPPLPPVPASLPPNWTEQRTPEGYLYYWNTVTHQSMWERPTA